MQTIKQFLRQYPITMRVDWADSNPNMTADDKWMREARHFRCIMRYHRKQMTVPFSQGCLIEREPTVADVLDCLASDASGIDNARSFDDWASDLGYDPDSRKAEKTFTIIQSQSAKLKAFLGDDGYEALLYQTERE